MRVTRGWLGATLVVLASTAANAQTPWTPRTGLPIPPQPPLLPTDMPPLPGQVVTQLPYEMPAPSKEPIPSKEPAPSVSGGGSTDNFLPPRPTTTQAWLDYEGPACCGPTGRHGPVGYDVYTRFGLSFPFAGGPIRDGLNMGYQFFLGGRSLLFNPPGDAAWVIDLAVFYMYNNGSNDLRIGFLTSTATIRALHRSGVSLGLGRDWYSSAPGFVTGTTACTRACGVDFGIRYGSAHVDLNVADPILTYARQQDNFGQSFLGIHSDWEFPQGGWSLVIGGRLEWDYTFTHVLRSADANFHEINGLLTIGVKY